MERPQVPVSLQEDQQKMKSDELFSTGLHITRNVELTHLSSVFQYIFIFNQTFRYLYLPANLFHNFVDDPGYGKVSKMNQYWCFQCAK